MGKNAGYHKFIYVDFTSGILVSPAACYLCDHEQVTDCQEVQMFEDQAQTCTIGHLLPAAEQLVTDRGGIHYPS